MFNSRREKKKLLKLPEEKKKEKQHHHHHHQQTNRTEKKMKEDNFQFLTFSVYMAIYFVRINEKIKNKVEFILFLSSFNCSILILLKVIIKKIVFFSKRKWVFKKNFNRLKKQQQQHRTKLN